MSGSLYADYGTITSAATRLGAVSRHVQGTQFGLLDSGLSSTSVAHALSETTAYQTARRTALAGLLDAKAAGVRQAVAEMIAADAGIARQVSQ